MLLAEILTGLFLVYLTLSLLVTTIHEIISTLWQFRSQSLQAGIKTMLCGSTTTPDEKELFDNFCGHPMLVRLKKPVRDTFFNRLILQNRRHDCWPSYLSGSTFADILFATLAGDDINTYDEFKARIEERHQASDSRTYQLLHGFLREIDMADKSEDDVDRINAFKQKLVHWFDESMQQVSSWYKHTSQLRVLTIGAVLAVTFNADTFQITDKLSRNSAIRAELNAQANLLLQDPFVLEQGLGAAETAQDSADLLRDLGADLAAYTKSRVEWNSVYEQTGLGWGDGFTDDFTGNKLSHYRRFGTTPSTVFYILYLFYKVIGLILTALALSLGAPFWFDLLKKFVNIRGVGRHSSTS